jgi:Zn-dependent protease with chaperone function
MKMKYGRMSFGKKAARVTIVHLNKPRSHALAGMVMSPLFAENIALVIDKAPLEDLAYDFSCLAFAAGGHHPRICLQEELYYGIKQGSAEARMILFHELGHYANNDYLRYNYQSGEYDNERRLTVANGAVLDIEAAADAFAIKYLGQGTVISGLSLLLARVQTMYSGDGYDAEDVSLLIKEIENRIRLAKEPVR